MDILTLMVTAIFGIEVLCVVVVICMLIYLIRTQTRVHYGAYPVKAVQHGPKGQSGTVRAGGLPNQTEEEIEQERLARERVEKENEAFSQLMGYSVEQAYGVNVPIRDRVMKGGDD